MLVYNIHQNAINIVLFLLICRIADPYRFAVAVARQVVEEGFFEFLFTVNAIHNLDTLILFR